MRGGLNFEGQTRLGYDTIHYFVTHYLRLSDWWNPRPQGPEEITPSDTLIVNLFRNSSSRCC
jgi:hypothetical protein